MLNKLVLAAVATAVALPVAASEITAGRAMEAELLNLDASTFSLSELGQISSEDNDNDRADRARFILQERASGVRNAVASDDAPTGYFGPTRIGRDD